MWRLEHIEILWFWMVIPVTVLLIQILLKRREKKLRSFGNSEKIIALIQSESKWQSIVKRWLWSFAVILLIFALSNPQSGKEQESVTNKGSNVIIALDLSDSMLAKDIAPSRLERSKKFLQNLVRKLSGDRVAFVVFAGKAYVQMPFTTDYGTFEMQLNTVTTDMMPTQGTALREAIQMAESLQGTENNPEKILILLSDGEDHDKGAISQAKKSSDKHLLIHTIGVGTVTGAPILETLSTGEIRYKKDKSGNQVITKLNEKNLQNIASAGGGKYFNIANERQALKEIQKSIKWAKSATGDEKVYTRYKNYFQYFLFPAIILLMLEIAGVHILTFRGSEKKTTTLLMLLFSLTIFSCSKNERQQAYLDYQKGDTESALKHYKKVVQKDSAAENLYNLATAFYNRKLSDSASVLYDKVLELQPDKNIISQTFFNKANIAYEKDDYQNALENLKKSLEFSPGNYRTQYNLSIVLSKLDDENQESGDKSQESGDKSQESGDKNQESSDKSQGSGDKNQESRAKSQESGDKNQEPRDENQESGDKNQESGDNQGNTPQQSKLSPQAVEQLFQALDQQEKTIQLRNMNKENEKKGTIKKVEKDW